MTATPSGTVVSPVRARVWVPRDVVMRTGSPSATPMREISCGCTRSAVSGTSPASDGDALTVRSGDILIPRISLQEPLRLECLHFVECIRERKRPLTDGVGGLRVVKVLDAAQRSLKSGGQPVAIEPLPQEIA